MACLQCLHAKVEEEDVLECGMAHAPPEPWHRVDEGLCADLDLPGMHLFGFTYEPMRNSSERCSSVDDPALGPQQLAELWQTDWQIDFLMVEILEHKNTLLTNPAPKLRLSVQMALTRREKEVETMLVRVQTIMIWILQQSNFILKRKLLSNVFSSRSLRKFSLPGCQLNKVNRWSGSESEFHKIPTLSQVAPLKVLEKLMIPLVGHILSTVAHLLRGMSPACAAAAGRHEEVLDLLLGTTGINHDKQQWSTIAQWFLNEGSYEKKRVKNTNIFSAWMDVMMQLKVGRECRSEFGQRGWRHAALHGHPGHLWEASKS